MAAGGSHVWQKHASVVVLYRYGGSLSHVSLHKGFKIRLEGIVPVSLEFTEALFHEAIVSPSTCNATEIVSCRNTPCIQNNFIARHTTICMSKILQDPAMPFSPTFTLHTGWKKKNASCM